MFATFATFATFAIFDFQKFDKYGLCDWHIDTYYNHIININIVCDILRYFATFCFQKFPYGFMVL